MTQVAGENNFAISYDPTETSGIIIPKRDYDAEISGIDAQWKQSEKGNRSKLMTLRILGATTEDGEDVSLRSVLTVGFYTSQKTNRRQPINFSTGWSALLKALGVTSGFKLELDPQLLASGSQEDKEHAYMDKLCAFLDTEVLPNAQAKTIRVAVDTVVEDPAYGPKSKVVSFRAAQTVTAMVAQKYGNHAGASKVQ